MKKSLLIICTLILTGCSLLKEEEPLPIYTLKSGPVEPNHILTQSIGVDIPLSEASLDIERIAVTPSTYARDYLAEGQWPEKLPIIVREVLVETLSARWGSSYVGRAGSGFQENYLFQTEIQDFSASNIQSTPEVYLKISFKILNLKTRKIIAGQTFTATERACSSSLEAIIGAFNIGLQTLLQQAMPWAEDALLSAR